MKGKKKKKKKGRLGQGAWRYVGMSFWFKSAAQRKGSLEWSRPRHKKASDGKHLNQKFGFNLLSHRLRYQSSRRYLPTAIIWAALDVSVKPSETNALAQSIMPTLPTFGIRWAGRHTITTSKSVGFHRRAPARTLRGHKSSARPRRRRPAPGSATALRCRPRHRSSPCSRPWAQSRPCPAPYRPTGSTPQGRSGYP